MDTRTSVTTQLSTYTAKNSKEVLMRHVEGIHEGQSGLVTRELIPNYLLSDEAYPLLDAVIAYAGKEELPHWHFVTYGFSELYAKQSPYPKMSGYGFELTFRLARQATERKPPYWVANFIQNIARYVFENRQGFDDYHYIHANGPICLDEETDLCGITFLTDPLLGQINTPNGYVKFLQMIALTNDELDAIAGDEYEHFLKKMRAQNELFITNLTRKSILAGINRSQGNQSGVL
jgi:hypothetical protein